MGIKECLNCPNAICPLQRTYAQKDCSFPTFDIAHPAKPSTQGDFKTVMFVEAGCLGGKVEGQGETLGDSLRDALANSETFVALNCPLKAQ